jgi:transposase
MTTKLKTKNEIVRERVDFSTETIYCGIDVHKKNWGVTIYLNDRFMKTFHQNNDPQALLSHLNENYPYGKYMACYEAGFCGFSVQRKLTALGIECLVANAADIPQTNKSALSKTDAVDSRRIGEALAKNMLRPIYIPSPEFEADRNLIRYRKKLVARLKGHKQSIKSTLFILDIPIPERFEKSCWTNTFIKWLIELQLENSSTKTTIDLMIDDVVFYRKKLYETNKLIRNLSQTERYKFQFEIVTSAPGIGLITGMTMLTEIGDISRFDSFSKFNSFVGLCPSQFSSGEKTRMGKMTVRSNKAIRSLIIEAAWIAIKYDPALAKKFSELEKIKTRKRAIVTIARKLLSRIYSIWTNQKKYEKGIKK